MSADIRGEDQLDVVVDEAMSAEQLAQVLCWYVSRKAFTSFVLTLLLRTTSSDQKWLAEHNKTDFNVSFPEFEDQVYFTDQRREQHWHFNAAERSVSHFLRNEAPVEAPCERFLRSALDESEQESEEEDYEDEEDD